MSEGDDTALHLSSLLATTPNLVFAALIGSLASGTQHEASDIDLLLVADVDADELFRWRHEALSALYELEGELGRELHVTAYARADFLAEAARPSGFLTTLCARPHRALYGSLAETLPASSLALLEKRALAFLARLEREGGLNEPYRQGLSHLRS